MEEVKYIPGDLVNPNGSIAKVTSVAPGLWKDNIEIGFSDGWNYTADPRDFDDEALGVPLTQEILEKNRWKYKRESGIDTYTFGEDICNSITIEISRDKEFCLSVSDSTYINLKIKYVHQLQHLLFGLGLPKDLKV